MKVLIFFQVDLETGEDFSFDETVVNEVIDLTGNTSSGTDKEDKYYIIA